MQQSHFKSLPKSLFADAAPTLARALLGCVLMHEHPEGTAAGIIVETEAYDQSDPASHSCRGRTPRNAPMFGPGGRAYVYRSYGLHWCMNVTCGLVGHGAAVLLRALQPLQGDALMLRRRLQPLRNKQPPATAYVARRLAVGPGNLCVAMAVASHHNDADLLRGPLRIVCDPKRVRGEVVATTRVGISIAQEVPWRFLLANNPHVSKAPSPARAS